MLEEWTHKKSVADLAGTMSLNVDKVWLKGRDGGAGPHRDVQVGDGSWSDRQHDPPGRKWSAGRPW